MRLRRFDRDTGLVLAGFVVLLAVENLAIGLGYRSQFVGPWEMGSARLYVSPIALALMVPVALALAVLVRLGRWTWIPAAVAGAALGIGVSTGRRMASLAIRAPFVLAVALATAVVAWQLARWLPRMRPWAIALAGAAIAIVAWLADAFVLTRLYPAFHLALLFVSLAGWSGIAVAVATSRYAEKIALGAIIVTAVSIAWTPYAARAVGPYDNLRTVLLEHAPNLGRAVLVASWISPPPPLEEDAAAATTLTQLRDRKGARALDFRGHDIVVVTIDALRADHVSSYGYSRKTTPNIDALAARGVRFEHAYCPTPHTSYSIASMMMGKYMKPLLAIGVDDSSETWPIQLRRYGYRTAAFYPPAVFFIDEHRFRRMRDENLGFEYRKEEFARPELRREQIERYLSEAPRDLPLFLWVHLFEPHEPYEMHPEHPFEGEPRVDAYDSEIAAADALVGEIVQLIGEKRPPGTVFIVSADHGEEHGDHGGRYHGTTVYEEQVRVPLVVVAPGVAPRVVAPPVQTIDLLPTTLAALDVPIPPRIRGRDLGPAIAGLESATEEGLAFAETDDYTLVARGSDRLVCARKIGSCTLFDIAKDPGQTQPIADRPARVTELRKLTAAIERETGKLESNGLPDALRRGLQGDREAAEDVAPLLDDARVDIRRLAARCLFQLKAPETTAQLRRAHTRDEDAEVLRWSAIALVRLGENVPVDASLTAAGAEERTAAALALAERGDARGEKELLARWPQATELDEAREILGAFSRLHSKAAVPLLVRSLDDVRLRPYVVEALGAIGDPRARDPLLDVFEGERYVHLRPLEARVLAALGGREKMMPGLTQFAGLPEPMTEAIDLAVLAPDRGGWTAPKPVSGPVTARLRVAKTGPMRLYVAGGQGPLEGTIAGVSVHETAPKARDVYVSEVGVVRAGQVDLRIANGGAIRAVWLVPREPGREEVPAAAPKAWDAGAP